MIQLFRFCKNNNRIPYFKAEKTLPLKNEDVRTLMKMHLLVWTWKIMINQCIKRLNSLILKKYSLFMTQVAIFSEQIDHHPEWENLFNTIKIKLITDDVKCIAVKDLFSAYAIDNIAMNLQVKSAESINDTRILEIAKIAESWNFNFDQFRRMIETVSKQI